MKFNKTYLIISKYLLSKYLVLNIHIFGLIVMLLAYFPYVSTVNIAVGTLKVGQCIVQNSPLVRTLLRYYSVMLLS